MENDSALLEKYRVLLAEAALYGERLDPEARLGITDPLPDPHQDPKSDLSLANEKSDVPKVEYPPGIAAQLDPVGKIRLFMSLFKGRADMYAKRLAEPRGNRAGILRRFAERIGSGLCRKSTTKCFECRHQLNYDALDEKVIEAHLRGTIVARLYRAGKIFVTFYDECWRRRNLCQPSSSKSTARR